MAVLFAAFSFVVASSAHGQTVKSLISVVQSEESSAARLQMLPDREQNLMARMPANSYHFGKVSAGDFVSPQNLTLQFSIATRVTKISSTPDFKIMPGGTCLEGEFYMAGGHCELLVEFTPQGAGRRVGRIAISHSASPQPASVLVAGYAEFPVVSFIPSLIGTPSEFVSGGQGVFNNAQNIAIDNGDGLYVADTGNNRIAYIDSSATITNLATATANGVSAPVGITVDPFGEVYFTEPAANLLYEIYSYGPMFQLSGETLSTCTVAAPCNIATQSVFTPGAMSTDGFGGIFFADKVLGAGRFVALSPTASYAHLADPFYLPGSLYRCVCG